jgi:two-component system chemotaxis response regulator CheY
MPIATAADQTKGRMAEAMRALVVDDSGSMRTIVSRILDRLGVDEIAEAENGLDALSVLEEGALPDVALVDWHMPGMNGYQFVCAVREQPRWRSMAIMMMTAENEHGDIVQALAAGATEYLIKPFTAEALVDKLSLLGLNPMTGVPA